METVLLPALESALKSAGLWRESAVLLLGVSGGPDSVALLHTLALARERAGFTMWACHVQHGLRGESTLEDEAFVRALCGSLSVPLRVLDAGLAATMETPGIETLARERRRALFAACMEDVGADGLLLAHHLDDQAETVLMRLLRGAGGAGLGGMRPVTPFGRGVLVRPFLGLRKEQLIGALQQAGLTYREDESNRACLTPRNTLRNDVMPRLEALYPQAAAHIAQAAAALREDETCLALQANALYRGALYESAGVFALKRAAVAGGAGCAAMDRSDIAPEHAELGPGEECLDGVAFDAPGDALALRALRRFYREGFRRRGLWPEERELSRPQSLALLALARGPAGDCLNLPCGLQALCGARYLHLRMQGGQPLTAAEPTAPIQISAALDGLAAGMAAPDGRIAETRALPGMADPVPPGHIKTVRLRLSGAEILAEVLTQPCPPPTSAREIMISPELLRRCQLRAPLPGDSIHPLGAPGSKPLRRYLTDRKVDEPFRTVLPVLAEGSRVLWIPGLCTAEALRAAPKTGQWRLRLDGDAAYLP